MAITKVRPSTLDLPSSGNVVYQDVTTIPGVDPTGVADSTAALNSAIAAASAMGAIFYFPTGTYLISSASLLLKSNISLVGAGKKFSVLKNTSFSFFAGPLLDTGAATSNISLQDLGFSYTGAPSIIISPSAQLALKLQCTANFRMQGCEVIIPATGNTCVAEMIGVNSWYSPKASAPATSDYFFEDVTLTYNSTNALSNLWNFNNVTSGLIIEDCRTVCSPIGILRGTNFSICNGAKLVNSILQGNIYLTGCTSCAVTNCSVQPQVNTNPAIELTLEAATISSLCSVIGNQLVNSGGGVGIRVNQLASVVNTLIEGNTITGGATSISISADNVTVVGNNCTSSSATSISVNGGTISSYVNITANTVQTTSIGIGWDRLQLSSITGNTIRTTSGPAIRGITNSFSIAVTGNHATASGGGATGITITGGNSTTVVVGNSTSAATSVSVGSCTVAGNTP